MARKTQAPASEESAPGIVLRAFQVPYGAAFLSFREGDAVPFDPDLATFARLHNLPIKWGDA